MSKVFDFANLPVTLKITNTNKAELATDAGTRTEYEVVAIEDVATEIENGLEFTPVAFDESGALKFVRIARKYKVSDREVKFHKTNIGKVLASEESMNVVAETSDAVAHYMSCAVDGITVEVVESSEAGE